MAKIRLSEQERRRRIAVSRGLTRSIGIRHAQLSKSMDSIYRSFARRLQKAVLKGDDDRVEILLAALYEQATQLLSQGLAFAVSLAYELLEADLEYEDSGSKEDKKSIFFWTAAIFIYIENLRKEIAWFRDKELNPNDLMLFLNNPLSYIVAKKLSMKEFQQTVNVGSGRRLQVKKDFSKQIYYAMMSALYKALQEQYQEREVVAYVGFRNGDYPCDICDEYEGRVMPIEEMVYPLHVNCICGWYVLYSDEVEGF